MDKVHAKAQGSQPGHALKPVIGPLSMRDALVVIGGVLVLVGSLVPIPWTRDVSVNMWIFPGLPFHLFVSLLLPLLVAAGFLWRRLTGRTRVRVASLSLDQAGSVVAIFAAAYFFNSYVASMSPAYLLGLLGALAMVAGTTLATYLGIFRRDFVPGGDSVLGADVYPVAQATKAPAAQATESKSEVFGASSAHTASAGRPGTPVTGKPEGRRETASAASAGVVAGSAAAAPSAGVAAVAGPASDKLAQSRDSSPAADRSGAADAKGAVQAAPAAANTDAPIAGKAGAPAPRSNALPTGSRAEQPRNDSSSIDDNHDTTDAAHPLTAWKSVAEDAPEDAPEAESAAGDEQRTAAEAAYGGTAPSTTAAKPKGPAADTAEESSKPGANRAGNESEARSGQDPRQQDAASEDAAHPATMATPRANTDIKATAALSRADIAAHQAAVERAKAEAESSFGAKAEAHEHEGHGEETASFWFALNHTRPVFHPANGATVGTLSPGTWILCLEDRGTEYLINLADGQPALLRNLDDLQFPEK